jgi:hypothetical protein
MKIYMRNLTTHTVFQNEKNVKAGWVPVPLISVKNTKIPCHCLKSNPDSSVIQPVAQSLY